MPTCFVVQPFDADDYDKRYKDTLAPAISAANLEPYRVDEDPSVEVLIDGIEKGIRDSVTCLADISESNQNVWYELGFAFATGTPVVMICNQKLKGQLPFDIQHRKVIFYKTGSARDFDDLKSKITARLKASIAARVTPPVAAQPLAEASVVVDVAELDILGKIALSTLAKHFDGHDSTTPFYEIKRDMMDGGFSAEEVTVALGVLVKKKMIAAVRGEDDSGYIISRYWHHLRRNGVANLA